MTTKPYLSKPKWTQFNKKLEGFNSMVRNPYLIAIILLISEQTVYNITLCHHQPSYHLDTKKK